MYENLSIFMDINGIEENDNIRYAAQLLYEDPKKSIISYTSKSYILENYKSFLNEEISKEEFFVYGDIYCKRYAYNYNGSIESLYQIYFLMNEFKNYFKDSLILIDQYAINYFEKKSSYSFNDLKSSLEKEKAYLLNI